MADEEHVDLPDDFERLLRQELSVHPSPAFAARVRADIAAARPPLRWTPWLFACGVAAAFTVAVLLPQRQDAVAPQAPPIAIPSPVAAKVTAPQPGRRLDSRGPRPEKARVRSLARASRSTPGDLPPVVVDRGQRAALSTLMRMVDQGRLTGDSFAQTTPTSMRPIAEQVVPIGVAPVAVSPMSAGGVLPHDIERN